MNIFGSTTKLNPITTAILVCCGLSAIFGVIAMIVAGALVASQNKIPSMCRDDRSKIFCRIHKNMGLVAIVAGLAQLAIGGASAFLTLLYGRIALLIFGTGHSLLVVPFTAGFSLMLISAHYNSSYGKGMNAGKAFYGFMFVDLLFCGLVGLASVPAEFILRYYVKDNKITVGRSRHQHHTSAPPPPSSSAPKTSDRDRDRDRKSESRSRRDHKSSKASVSTSRSHKKKHHKK